MKLDARKPIFILVGNWNPAIFQPGWIARYLFNIPEGQQVQLAEVITAERLGSPIHYFSDSNVGILASTERVEVYANDFDSSTTKLVEQVCIRLIQALPHTPLGPFGVNLSFSQEDPNDELLDLLRTRDNVEQHFKIVKQKLTSTIELPDEVALNFSRQPSAQAVVFDFNYHHKQITSPTAESLLDGAITKYLNHSQTVLKTLYGIEGYEVLVHDLTVPQAQ
jgi:hypothetical protein